MMSVAHHVAMGEQLQRGLSAPGDAHQQRMVLNAIMRLAFTAGVAPLDFIASQLAGMNPERRYSALQPPAPWPLPASASVWPATPPLTAVAATPRHQCRSCGRTFTSQTALNGHGEARCAEKQTQPLNTNAYANLVPGYDQVP